MLLRRLISFFFFFPFLMTSCVSTKNATYLNTVTDATIQSSIVDVEPVIQKNDLLSISISSLNPDASRIFNTPNTESVQGMTAAGYLVNQDGTIQLPILGNIKAEGLTKKALTEKITESLREKKLLLDPIVNIRYLNFRVTVLGEVGNPSVINVANEKITLLEALGRAGDMNIYGRREDVLIVREEEGQRITKRINLNSSELLTSPYYYLKNNDVVYVAPNKDRVNSISTNTRWLGPLLSGLSFALLIVDRITR